MATSSGIGPEHMRDWSQQVSDWVGDLFTSLHRQRDVDIRAAVAAWDDLPDLLEHLFAIEEDKGGMVQVQKDGTIMRQTTVSLADRRHLGAPRPWHDKYVLEPVNRFRSEREYHGKHFRVLLVHRDEVAKVPSGFTDAPADYSWIRL